MSPVITCGVFVYSIELLQFSLALVNGGRRLYISASLKRKISHRLVVTATSSNLKRKRLAERAVVSSLRKCKCMSLSSDMWRPAVMTKAAVSLSGVLWSHVTDRRLMSVWVRAALYVSDTFTDNQKKITCWTQVKRRRHISSAASITNLLSISIISKWTGVRSLWSLRDKTRGKIISLVFHYVTDSVFSSGFKLKNFLRDNETLSSFLRSNVSFPEHDIQQIRDADVNLETVRTHLHTLLDQRPQHERDQRTETRTGSPSAGLCPLVSVLWSVVSSLSVLWSLVYVLWSLSCGL